MNRFHRAGRDSRRLVGIIAAGVIGGFGVAPMAAAQPDPAPDAQPSAITSVVPNASPSPTATPNGPGRARFDGVQANPEKLELRAGEKFTLTFNYTVADKTGYNGTAGEITKLTNAKCDAELKHSDGDEPLGPNSLVFNCSVITSNRPVAITYSFAGSKGTVRFSHAVVPSEEPEPSESPKVTNVRFDGAAGDPPKIALQAGAKFTLTFRYTLLDKSGYNGTAAELTKLTNAKCDAELKHSEGEEPLGSNSLVFNCSVVESNRPVIIDYRFGGDDQQRGTLRYEATGDGGTTQRPTPRRPGPAIADTGAPVAAIFAAGGLALAGAGIVVIALSRHSQRR